MQLEPRPGPAVSNAPGGDPAVAFDRLAAQPPAPRPFNVGQGAPGIRMVLDTNVSLDLIVFNDPRWAPLAACIADGTCDVLMRDDCRAEFARVLAYPQFALDATGRIAALRAFDALHRWPLAGECRAQPSACLPRCRDPDDQKFLELAWQAHAQVLLSKDKALLKLARRHRRAGLFEILSPQAWLDRCQAATQAT